MNFFQSLVYSKSYDIICITETWLHDEISNSEIIPTNYTTYRKDRKSRGGGVLIAINNDIPSQLITTHPLIEMISIELDLSPHLFITCLYIPPNCSDSYQQEVLNYLSTLNKDDNTILLGDFNIPDTNWSTLHATAPFSHSFCTLTHSANFIQLITEPTHKQGNILDLVLTNAPHRIQNLHVDSTLCSQHSDHFLISANILNSSQNTRPMRDTQYVLLYSRANFAGMECFLDTATNAYILANIDSVELAWSVLKQMLTDGCEQFIPKFKVPAKPTPRWFNSNVRHLLNCTHTLRRLHKRKPTTNNYEKLLRMETCLRTSIEASRDEYLQRIVSQFQANPKKLYEYLKHLSNSKFKPQFIVSNDTTVQDPRQMAEIFKEYFHSTFTSSDFILPPTSQLPTPLVQLNNIQIDRSDVYEALSNLDKTKAVGCDSIHPSILKTCATTLLEPIFHLFTLCLRTSSIPLEWKLHKIKPIPKKGNLLAVNNYRPISLLCILSKMLESIIFNKIINFIQPQLSKSQFGFLRNRSCLSQLLTSLASIYEAVDNRNQVDVLYLDFRKAFDSVPHQELLYKLWQMGITGSLWSWFKCYLSSRSHYVCIDGINSSSLPVRSGVPQGSILGPLLFLIYINDLPNVITNTACYMFADDTKFIKSISCFNDHLQFQQDIISVETWCQTWKLPLNFSKCNSLRFTLAQHQSDDFKYTLNNELIQPAQSQRDLGIITTVNLTWADHYNHVCSKAYRSLNLIRRTISTNSPVNLKNISLVRSHLQG